MLKQRIITASILAILIIWAVLKLPVAGFGVVLLLVILPGAWEWTRLASLSKIRDRMLYVGGVLAVIVALACRPASRVWHSASWACLALLALYLLNAAVQFMHGK